MIARNGYEWVLTAKGLANDFIREMFIRYYKTDVPAHWILNEYVIERKIEENGKRKEHGNT